MTQRNIGRVECVLYTLDISDSAQLGAAGSAAACM